ncbi:MAG: hemerythrin, partial [Acidobacteria bacterium]|nr:hemerythrin [Acidobacteriota bacterium]
MAYIKWGPDLEIGHSTIDYQHRTLVNRLNDLYDIKQSGKGGEVLLQVVLDELVQYAQYHFATEEKLM